MEECVHENATVGGLCAMIPEYENGATLTIPLSHNVLTRKIGRGATALIISLYKLISDSPGVTVTTSWLQDFGLLSGANGALGVGKEYTSPCDCLDASSDDNDIDGCAMAAAGATDLVCCTLVDTVDAISAFCTSCMSIDGNFIFAPLVL